MSRIIRFEVNPAAGMLPSKDIPLDTFTTDDTTEKYHSYFETKGESITTGIWECAPSKMAFDSYPAHEIDAIS